MVYVPETGVRDVGNKNSSYTVALKPLRSGSFHSPLGLGVPRPMAVVLSPDTPRDQWLLISGKQQGWPFPNSVLPSSFPPYLDELVCHRGTITPQIEHPIPSKTLGCDCWSPITSIHVANDLLDARYPAWFSVLPCMHRDSLGTRMIL